MIAQLLASHPTDRLTARERDVLALIAAGRSNAAIAEALSVSHKAVDHHSDIVAKLDLPPSATDNRRVLAVLAYLNAS